MHRCPNRACPSRGLETLYHWVGAALDIENVGGSTIKKLWDEGIVRSLPDLYRLTAEQLAELEGFAEISAARAHESIQRSKEQPFSRVLFGLNIPKVGWVIARSLALHFRTVERARRRDARAARGGRGDRARACRADRRVVRRPGEPRARRRAARARAAARARGRRSPARGAPHRQPVRHHRDARGLDEGGGEGCARGTRREGHRLGLEEDDRRRRRREPRIEGAEGREARRARSRRSRPACRCSTWRDASQNGHEAVLRGARRPVRHGRSVVQDREDVAPPTKPASADARFVVPVLRDDAAARRPHVEPRLERPRDAGDGERGDEGVADRGIGDAGAQDLRERADGRAVEAREPRAVGDAHAGERHAGGRERRADDPRAGCASSRGSSTVAPSSFSTISAAKLSLSAFIRRTIARRAARRGRRRSVSASAGARPAPGASADGDPALLERFRERARGGRGRAVRAGEAEDRRPRAPTAVSTRCRGTTASSRARRVACRSACRRRRRDPRCAGSPSRRISARAGRGPRG